MSAGIDPTEQARVTDAQARLAEIRANLATPDPVLDAQALDLVRARVTQIRADRLDGRHPLGRLPAAMTSWPPRPGSRRAVRWPSNTGRRLVVAAWPRADRSRHRAAAVALWAVMAVGAAGVALTLAAVAVTGHETLRTPLRAARTIGRRCRARRHRKAWERYWATSAGPGPGPVLYRTGFRRRLTTTGIIALLLVAAVGYVTFLAMLVQLGADKGAQRHTTTTTTTIEATP